MTRRRTRNRRIRERKNRGPSGSLSKPARSNSASAQIQYKGKTFVEHTGAYSRPEAERKAQDLHERGYWTLIRETGEGYTVYAAAKDKPKKSKYNEKKKFVSFSPGPRGGYEVTVKYSFANGAEAKAAYEALREEAS